VVSMKSWSRRRSTRSSALSRTGSSHAALICVLLRQRTASRFTSPESSGAQSLQCLRTSALLLRVLTTTYTGSTEARALDGLRDAGADVRVS
jgi:hypothetical protein